MAFTSRSQRNTSFIPSHTLSTPAPGSYLSIFDRPKPLYGQAPFGSTSKRDGKSTTATNSPQKDQSHTTSDTVPAPGHYFRQPSKEEISRSQKQKVSSSVFRSKVSRFDVTKVAAKNADMGPGAYHKPMEWIKKPNARGRRSSQSASGTNEHGGGIVWVKVSTAPSIPSIEQSHGYEEGPQGELIRQKPPVRGYKGTKEDAPGPGDYQLPDKSETQWDRQKGRGVFKSTSKRANFLEHPSKYTPAPGQYEIKDEWNRPAPISLEIGDPNMAPETTAGRSAVFASKTNRSNWTAKQVTNEAPHTYIDPYSETASSFKRKKIPERFQNFGSSSLRDGSLVPHSNIAGESPGPGHFIKETSTVGKSKSIFPSSLHGPFLSTSERFRENMTEKDSSPAPGQYEQQSFVSDVYRRAKVGAYGVFGSTSRRFGKQKSNAPGVGSYDPKVTDDLSKLQKRNDPRSSVFASRTERANNSPPKSVAAPDPGHYEVRDTWLKPSHTRVANPLIPRQPRFKGSALDVPTSVPAKVGPGRYNDHGSFFRTKNKKQFSTKATTFATSHRFNELANVKAGFLEHTSPGPGTYDSGDSWNKKTYNVTVAP